MMSATTEMQTRFSPVGGRSEIEWNHPLLAIEIYKLLDAEGYSPQQAEEMLNVFAPILLKLLKSQATAQKNVRDFAESSAHWQALLRDLVVALWADHPAAKDVIPARQYQNAKTALNL